MQRKQRWIRGSVGIALGIGLALGMAGRPVMTHAATQVSLAEKTQTQKTLSDAAFKRQLEAPVNANQPIKDVFPDAALAAVVADALNVKVDDNLQAAVNVIKHGETLPDSDFSRIIPTDVHFLISPDWDEAPVTRPILNWTGMSAVAHIFGTVEVDQQPNFDQKAAQLLKCVEYLDPRPNVVAGTYVSFYNDDIGNKGFGQLIDVGAESTRLRYIELDVSNNQITDFSAMERVGSYGMYGNVTGMNEQGSAEETSALQVHNSSVVIPNGVPGSQFLPHSYGAPQNTNIGRFRLETSAETAAYQKESHGRFPDLERTAQINSPLTLDKLYATNQIDYADHRWGAIYPWQHAITSAADQQIAEKLIPEISQPKLLGMVIQNIPDDVSSLTVRSVWANMMSGGNHPISTLVKIPLERESHSSGSSASRSAGTSMSTPAGTNSRTVAGSDSSSRSAATDSPASSVEGPSSDSVGPAVVQKGQAVYALKKVGLYRYPTFTAKTRRAFYPKQPRIRRPQFVVTGYARSRQGRLRYRVRDINHGSRTFGRTGYLTAQATYVTHLYYQRRPARVRVIGLRGVNGYQHVNLTGKQRHYRRGQVLQVRRLVHYHLTTRLVLTNGQLVTANKTLVQAKK